MRELSMKAWAERKIVFGLMMFALFQRIQAKFDFRKTLMLFKSLTKVQTFKNFDEKFFLNSSRRVIYLWLRNASTSSRFSDLVYQTLDLSLTHSSRSISQNHHFNSNLSWFQCKFDLDSGYDQTTSWENYESFYLVKSAPKEFLKLLGLSDIIYDCVK